MKKITESEAYLLGILYGKGSIDPIGNEIILKFRVKFRRPTDASLRSDNIHTESNGREYIESLKSKLTNDFSAIMRLLFDAWDTNASIDLPNSYSIDDWNMKEITITTERIPKDFSRLKELLNVDELNNSSLEKFPFHLEMEYSKPISLAFIQGICDSCSLVPNEASSSFGGKGEPRIQLEPDQRRWELPIGLCRLFQLGLEIPVANINWGHPQIRTKWKHQNHQFRVKLKNIPPEIELYRLNYKREEYNNLYRRRRIRYAPEAMCPYSKRIHEGEKIKLYRSNNINLHSDLLDKRLRGIDIDIKNKKSLCVCKLLGCKQCEDFFEVDIE